MIPKRIIFTHISSYLLSDLQRECLEKAQSLHPDWSVEFYSDNDCKTFVSENFPDLVDLYHSYHRNIQRVDLFRILVILSKGGFYLDLDVFLHHRLDELLECEAVFPIEWEMTEDVFHERHRRPLEKDMELTQLGNYAFGAKANHPFLWAIIEEMIFRTQYLEPEFTSDFDVLFTSGPDLISSVYHDYSSSLKDSITLLKGEPNPSAPFFPAETSPHWYQFGQFGNHLLEGTWKMP